SNLLITNCQFLYGYRPINLQCVSNSLIQGCTIIKWGGANAFTGATNNTPTNTANTTNYCVNNVGLLGNNVFSINILSNFYNGNANLVSNTLVKGYVNTNLPSFTNLASSGMFRCFFIGPDRGPSHPSGKRCRF